MKRFGPIGGLGLAFLAGVALLSASAVAPPSHPAGRRPYVELIRVDGSINPAVADFIADSLDDAEQNRADALVIELDTPGGLLSSMQRIVEQILSAPVPVIVYVAPSGARAASAGTFITEAANIAAMAPGTTIGAAHPVGMEGEVATGALGQKLENFAATFGRTIAKQRGRDPRWMEQAVRESAALDERDALARHVIDIVAPDLRSLLAQASGRTVKTSRGEVRLELADANVARREMRLGQRALNVLADPNIMYLLMIGGLLGLYFEFAHPGVFFPGAAGAICLLLALASFEVLPIRVAALLLVLLGLALLISELYVVSYGVLGLGGLTAFVLGSLFLIDTGRTNVRVNRGLIAGAAIAFAAVILGLGWVVAKGRRERASTGREGLIGEVGEVREAIAPERPGRVFVHGENWRAISDEPIAAGASARVTAVKGLEIEVRRVH